MNKSNKNFGSFIREIRISNDIGQRELAKKIGIAASYLNDIEKNKRSAPKNDIIKKLSLILKVDLDLLNDLAGSSKKTLPPDIIDYCLLILGASVGCRFADKTFSEIGRNALHSFVATFMLVILGLCAAYIASLVIDKNFFTLLLSYCPGGIYEVAVIAIAFDLEPDFVAFHHIIRLLMILFIVPIILRLIDKKGSTNS